MIAARIQYVIQYGFFSQEMIGVIYIYNMEFRGIANLATKNR